MPTFFALFVGLLPSMLVLVAFSRDWCGWVTLITWTALTAVVVCLSLAWPQYPDWMNTVLGCAGAFLIVMADRQIHRAWWRQ